MPLIEHAEKPPSEAPLLRLRRGPRFVVAIPARDEERHIGACLTALANQEGAPEFSVLIVLNNCADGTEALVRSLAPELPFDLHLYSVAIDPCDAAIARRLAMNAAVAVVGGGGAILTTDADSRVAPRWLATIAEEFDHGVDLVCGFVTPDTDEQFFDLPVILRGAMEFQYSQATAELVALADPDPFDPWPNHLMETGASLAVTAEAYCALGGVPNVCPGEDRALADLARRRGRRIRHSLSAHVVTSTRLDGRAPGGWAENLQARLTDPHGQCHDLLEPARRTFYRAALRSRYLRARHERSAEQWARALAMPFEAYAPLHALQPFEAFAELEARSPRLARQRLWAADLPRELAALQRLIRAVQTARASGGFSSPLEALRA